jgi:hypothetical protein
MPFTKTQSSVEQAVWPPKSGRSSFDAAPPAFHIRLLGRLLVGRGFRNRNPWPVRTALPCAALRHDAAVRCLCEELTATETVFPGTDLRLACKLG